MVKNKNIENIFGEVVLKELPSNYQLMESSSNSSYFVEAVKSKFHNDNMYNSFHFYKPISRLFPTSVLDNNENP